MKKALERRTNMKQNLNIPFKKAEIINLNKVKESKEKGVLTRRNAEVALWKAVIMQSVLDVMNNSNRAADILAKKVAIDWFSIKNENFIKVCGYANLNPDWVLKKIRIAIENPRSWRRECDLKKSKK